MENQRVIAGVYRLIREIGAGRKGVVYLAEHLRLNKKVVLKASKGTLSRKPEKNRREVDALKDLNHARIPQVYDFVEEDGMVYTVIEYIEGNSFEELLSGGCSFTQVEVAKWYRQLASALDTLHRKKICHRDIKPANIMLTPGGDACLIDFNSAQVKDSSERFVSRSPGYASPEQYEMYERLEDAARSRGKVTGYRNPQTVGGGQLTVNNERWDDDKTELSFTLSPPSVIDWVRSDIYNLGATMYHILTGIRPKARAKEVVPLSKHDRFDPGLVRIIEKSMQPNPARRFASAPELSDALRRLKQRGKTNSIILSPLATILVIATTSTFCAATATIISTKLINKRYYG